MGRLRSRVFHNSHEAAPEFVDALRLTKPDGLMRDQSAADPQGRRASHDEFRGGLLIHSTGGDQRDVWIRSLERFNVVGAAHFGAGKNLHEITTGFPGFQDFGRGERAGDNQRTIFAGDFKAAQVDSRAGEKLRSRFLAVLRGLAIRQFTGAHNQAGMLPHQNGNKLDGPRFNGGELQDRNPRSRNLLSGEESILDRRNVNRRDDSDLLNPGLHFRFGHHGALHSIAQSEERNLEGSARLIVHRRSSGIQLCL